MQKEIHFLYIIHIYDVEIIVKFWINIKLNSSKIEKDVILYRSNCILIF